MGLSESRRGTHAWMIWVALGSHETPQARPPRRQCPSLVVPVCAFCAKRRLGDENQGFGHHPVCTWPRYKTLTRPWSPRRRTHCSRHPCCCRTLGPCLREKNKVSTAHKPAGACAGGQRSWTRLRMAQLRVAQQPSPRANCLLSTIGIHACRMTEPGRRKCGGRQQTNNHHSVVVERGAHAATNVPSACAGMILKSMSASPDSWSSPLRPAPAVTKNTKSEEGQSLTPPRAWHQSARRRRKMPRASPGSAPQRTPCCVFVGIRARRRVRGQMQACG